MGPATLYALLKCIKQLSEVPAMTGDKGKSVGSSTKRNTSSRGSDSQQPSPPRDQPPIKQKAYRAQGFHTLDGEEVTKILRTILRHDTRRDTIRIRTLAPSADHDGEYTAVFELLDGVDPPVCGPEYPLQGAVITFDTTFEGFTVLRSPNTSEPAIE